MFLPVVMSPVPGKNASVTHFFQQLTRISLRKLAIDNPNDKPIEYINSIVTNKVRVPSGML